MFCSDECWNNFLHEHECGMTFCDDKRRNYQILNEFRALLLAIDICFLVYFVELVHLVEESIKTDPKEIPESI